MKKSMIFIILILTSSLFMMQYSLASHQNFNNIVYSEKKAEYHYTIQLPHSILKNDKKMIIKTIKETADQHHINFFLTKSNKENYIKYVYLTSNQYLKSFKTENIKQFDHSFHLTIKSLDNIIKDSYQIEGEAIITASNTDDYISFRNEMNNRLSIHITEITSKEGQIDMMPWIILSIFAFYLIFTLLLIYNLLGSFKRFSIYKLNGYDFYTIWKDSIIDIIFKQILTSYSTFTLLTFIICRQFNHFVFIFLFNSYLLLGLLCIITFIISSLLIALFTKVKPIDYLKNKSVSHYFIIFNQIVFLIIVVLITTLSSVSINKGEALLSRYNNHTQWEKTKKYYLISELSNVENPDELSSKSFLNKQKELFKELNRLGSILADFNEYDKQTLNKTSMAYINTNYLKEEKVMDSHNKRILINENESRRVVLVDEKTPFSKEEIVDITKGMYDISQGIKIIYYKHNQRFFTYNSQITNNYTNMIQSPIIQVLTENNGKDSDYNLILGYKYNPYKIKANRAKIINILEKYQLSQYVDNYITAYDEMSMLNHNEWMLFIGVIIAIITLISLMIIITLQNIKLYILQNIKLLSIQKMNGYRFIDKYKSLILMSNITFILSFIISLLMNYSLFYLLALYTLILLTWMILFLIHTKYQEKQSIILMLKGNQ